MSGVCLSKSTTIFTCSYACVNFVQICSWCHIYAAMQLTDKGKMPMRTCCKFTHTFTHAATVTRTLWRYQGNQNTRANYSYSCRLWDTNSYSGTLKWTNTPSSQAIYFQWAVNESMFLWGFASMDVVLRYKLTHLLNLMPRSSICLYFY